MIQRKILLAEDDMDDQKLFYEFLHDRTDIQLMPFVENGVELLHFLKTKNGESHIPDLIILDQNMPKRNGLQTLQMLKAEHRYKHVPVVIYSTYADQQLVNEASEKGACKVITKPLSKEGYDQMMDDLLKLIP